MKHGLPATCPNRRTAVKPGHHSFAPGVGGTAGADWLADLQGCRRSWCQDLSRVHRFSTQRQRPRAEFSHLGGDRCEARIGRRHPTAHLPARRPGLAVQRKVRLCRVQWGRTALRAILGAVLPHCERYSPPWRGSGRVAGVSERWAGPMLLLWRTGPGEMGEDVAASSQARPAQKGHSPAGEECTSGIGNGGR
jgi:hypothetical protein